MTKVGSRRGIRGPPGSATSAARLPYTSLDGPMRVHDHHRLLARPPTAMGRPRSHVESHPRPQAQHLTSIILFRPWLFP